MPPSNETLDYKIISMEKQNTKEHNQIFKLINDFISSADDKYATKESVESLKKRLNTDDSNKTNVKLERIKTRGAIIVAIVGFIGLYFTR